jgi:hypothetical protein
MIYNDIINKFITENFKFLLECATNILKSKKTDPNDLVAELTIYLYDHQSKIEPYLDINMLLGFSVSWMNNQARWATTNFNRKYQINIEFDESILQKMVHTTVDSLEDDDIKDLRTIYTDEQVEKILKVRSIVPTLSRTNQIIYNAYFNEGLSYDKIKDRYTFFKRNGKKIIYYKSKVSIFNLMTDLKNEIRKKL